MSYILSRIKEKEYDVIDDFYTTDCLDEYADADAISIEEEAFMHGYLKEEDECA